jgi:hypothetical protein
MITRQVRERREEMERMERNRCEDTDPDDGAITAIVREATAAHGGGSTPSTKRHVSPPVEHNSARTSTGEHPFLLVLPRLREPWLSAISPANRVLRTPASQGMDVESSIQQPPAVIPTKVNASASPPNLSQQPRLPLMTIDEVDDVDEPPAPSVELPPSEPLAVYDAATHGPVSWIGMWGMMNWKMEEGSKSNAEDAEGGEIGMCVLREDGSPVQRCIPRRWITAWRWIRSG